MQNASTVTGNCHARMHSGDMNELARSTWMLSGKILDDRNSCCIHCFCCDCSWWNEWKMGDDLIEIKSPLISYKKKTCALRMFFKDTHSEKYGRIPREDLWRLACSYHCRRLTVQILLSISAIAEFHSYNLLVLLLIISRVVTEGHGGQNQIAQAPFITQTVVRSYLKHLHELSFYLVPNIHPYMSCQESALDSNNLIRCIWPAEKIRN